jgi:hypothetical protein
MVRDQIGLDHGHSAGAMYFWICELQFNVTKTPGRIDKFRSSFGRFYPEDEISEYVYEYLGGHVVIISKLAKYINGSTVSRT